MTLFTSRVVNLEMVNVKVCKDSNSARCGDQSQMWHLLFCHMPNSVTFLTVPLRQKLRDTRVARKGDNTVMNKAETRRQCRVGIMH